MKLICGSPRSMKLENLTENTIRVGTEKILKHIPRNDNGMLVV
jgi:hypothetical protein